MRQSGRLREQVFAFDAPSVRAFFMARHPLKTAHHVAAETGFSVRAVQKWLDGNSEPSFSGMCRLVVAYGPEFLAACVPGPAWLSVAAANAQRERLQADLHAIEAQIARLPEFCGAR